tara:strand:+ start:415 stop:1836 length:1422 start_codon:yes stop_codon:yes gene_type:complete
MPKISIIFILLIYFHSALSQGVITPLKGKLNSSSSEINFLRINDSIAFYTNYLLDENKLKSEIKKAKKINYAWFPLAEKRFNYDKNYGNFAKALDSEVSFFNVCSEDFSKCELYKEENNNILSLKSINDEAFGNKYNSQPHFFKYKNQNYLLFVSNRQGGYGGLDIWVCVIDKSGRIGAPINAGPNINSKYDEITPFFNSNESKLYFSSNKIDNNLGGFDIYFSMGYPNIWQPSENMVDFNSIRDEMYLNFYDKNTGYFASNRDSDCINTDSCCTDIYQFDIPTDFSKLIEDVDESAQYDKYLPLNLYFDNDKPSVTDFQKDSNLNYKDSYISYFLKLDQYKYHNKYSDVFFEDSLKQNFNNLNKLLTVLLNDLNNGFKIKIKIQGYSSKLADEEYNNQLSSQRIRSLVNYFSFFNNGKLVEHLSNKSLTIVEVPLGESQSFENKDQNNLSNIYGIDAMLNRKVSILKIDSYK